MSSACDHLTTKSFPRSPLDSSSQCEQLWEPLASLGDGEQSQVCRINFSDRLNRLQITGYITS